MRVNPATMTCADPSFSILTLRKTAGSERSCTRYAIFKRALQCNTLNNRLAKPAPWSNLEHNETDFDLFWLLRLIVTVRIARPCRTCPMPGLNLETLCNR